MERWKTVNDFPNYEISDEGRIRKSKNGQILHHAYNPKGYSIIVLYKNGEQHMKKIHRLVAEAFCEGASVDLQINHIDGNKSNNRYDNLEWCTCSDNIQHAYNTGLKKPPHMVSVRVVETGEIFESMTDCAKAIGGDARGISACFRGEQRSHRGYHFDFE